MKRQILTILIALPLFAGFPSPPAQAQGASASAQQQFSRGFSLFQAGDFRAAVAVFEDGLKLDPGNALGQFFLAETQIRRYAFDAARERYRGALAAGLAGTQAAEAKARLADLDDTSLERFVTRFGDALLQLSFNTALDQAERDARTTALMDWGLDDVRVMKLMMGRYAYKMSAAQAASMRTLAHAMVVGTFRKAMAQFASEDRRLALGRVRSDGADARVRTVALAGSSSQSIDVDWYLEQKDGRFRVYDIEIGGISLVTNYREAMGSILQDNGGNFDALIATLRARLGL